MPSIYPISYISVDQYHLKFLNLFGLILIFTAHTRKTMEHKLDLKQKENEAILNYTSNGHHGDMNRYLKKGNNPESGKSSSLACDINTIHQVLNENKLSQPLYVIRGIEEEECDLYSSNIGKTVEVKGFLSTSRYPRISDTGGPKFLFNQKLGKFVEAHRNGGIYMCRHGIICIYLPTGAPAVDLSQCEGVFQNELEVLIDYGQKLHLIRKENLEEVVEDAKQDIDPEAIELIKMYTDSLTCKNKPIIFSRLDLP
ncbi:hypothetical protein TRFO_42003 [Tritrichomonas foetus]|uniref:ADP ribosyltransferase domain-containing protein n=1 Tax=Tritrichomonas foetus TaxID=1144522 RepID=A0A1J4KY51_9EUKA|nr:hypothetical protein TRFO_42003 [Tritrichomonas foetus]|eukprot:OHT16167.1 hypothetical protein TRFO_42003 [Tritrichomonas foetus]